MTDTTTDTTTELPSLLYDETERDLRGTVHALLEERSAWTEVLARVESDEPRDEKLWALLATELGLAGLLVPEALGGAGASAREAAVVLEELGRAVAPVPFLESAVLATSALLRCGDAAAEALGLLASGGGVGALVVPATTWPGAPFPRTVMGVPEGDVVRLTGTVTSVLAGDRADLLVVPALVDGRPHLGLVEVADVSDALRRTRVTSLDLTRPIADVTFEDCPARVVARPEAAEEAVQYALQVGAALLASEQLGVAERCLQITVEYLKIRHQFGRPIGSFQALKHRAADLWAEINAARAAARYAASRAAQQSPDLPVAAVLAQAYCGDVAIHAAEECVQLHGGIGFTWEHPAHLYLKRAIAQLAILGDADRHRATLAGLVHLPAPTG
jgi:alkylation response protein AidB-like acyl-CoA dehydrogenase